MFLISILDNRIKFVFFWKINKSSFPNKEFWFYLIIYIKSIYTLEKKQSKHVYDSGFK